MTCISTKTEASINFTNTSLSASAYLYCVMRASLGLFTRLMLKLYLLSGTHESGEEMSSMKNWLNFLRILVLTAGSLEELLEELDDLIQRIN